MEEEKKGSCLSKGCLGCFGISLLSIILLLVILIGGSYWFIKHKIFFDEPLQVTAEPLAKSDVIALEKKLKSIDQPKIQDNRLTLTDNELTYLINKELQKAKEEAVVDESAKDKFDIAAVDVGLDSNQMDFKMSLKINNRYLNMQAIGTPKIVENELRFDTRKIKIGQIELSSSNVTGVLNTQINKAIEAKLQELQFQQYIGYFEKISIEDGKLIVEMKKSAF